MVYYRIDDNIELELVSTYNADIILDLINRNREYLAKYLSWVDETTSTDVIIENTKKTLKAFGEKTGIGWVVKFDKQIIGRISIWEAEEKSRIFEVGYWIAEAFSRKGIMTECIKKVIDIGFDYLKAEKIEICCIDENTGSNRIPQKLGFLKEGTRRNSLKIRDKIYNMNIYGLLKEERR